MTPPTIKSILRHLDSESVSRMAQKESRNREVYLPPVSVYRWWARRTLAVNSAILEAFNVDFPNGPHLIIDPFEGGGVIPLAAISQGHRVYAQDLNPWAANGLATAMRLADPDAIKAGAAEVEDKAADLLRRAYSTKSHTGRAATVAHTFRVSTSSCPNCRVRLRHFPHAMVSLLQRKERAGTACFLACPVGHVFRGKTGETVPCPECSRAVDPGASYTRGRDVTCWKCAITTSLDDHRSLATWKWEAVLVERVLDDGSREIGVVSASERKQAEKGWAPTLDLGLIPRGNETEVLLRHGFTKWIDIYPERQRAVMEQLLAFISEITDESVRETLRWALLGTAEMAGYLSRWDRWYLKSYESMAGHRFNFTTLPVEPNVWGTPSAGRGTFTRRVVQMCKAAEWFNNLDHPPEKVLGPSDPLRVGENYDVRVVCGSSEHLELANGEALLCLTDPPYHDDVQYGELSIPLRAWAGLDTNPLVGEAVVNLGSGTNSKEGEYRQLLTKIFAEVHRCLRPNGHLIFSYANRSPEAWVDVIGALNDAGYRCAGYAVVHSENETDHAKSGVRACTQDLILDMVPVSEIPIRRSYPKFSTPTDEEAFLSVVGSYLLKTGRLPKDWGSRLTAELRSTKFLN